MQDHAITGLARVEQSLTVELLQDFQDGSGPMACRARPTSQLGQQMLHLSGHSLEHVGLAGFNRRRAVRCQWQVILSYHLIHL